ncbi:MAG: FtsX-like permease family protein [Planctomycetales bacterium]|nr:FtsX-like permease family protein [Planctomycetales bacterium]
MKTPLAVYNLWHQGAKTAVSVGGVAFALLLVFMQLGFMGAVSHTATNVLQSLEFDILIRARDYLHLYEPGEIDRKWLAVAHGTDGVRSASPLWTTVQNWRTLPSAAQQDDADFESRYLPIAIMAFEPQDQVFRQEDIRAQQAKLFADDVVLLDDSTQADYGPLNGLSFEEADLGRKTEIGERSFTIDGLFKLGTGLSANGALLMSQRGFSRITPWDVRTTTNMGLVTVRQNNDPVHLQQTLQQLRERTGELVTDRSQSSSFLERIGQWFGAPAAYEYRGPVVVLTRDEALVHEQYRWLWQTPIGLIFQMGVVLSLMVGAAIVYMVLSTDVANRLPEYATLLAMGYSRKYLASIVMTQAVFLCTLGFVAAYLIAEVLYRVTYSFSSIPMSMTPTRAVLVSVLGILMCCASGLLALRKLWKAEPASLF